VDMEHLRHMLLDSHVDVRANAIVALCKQQALSSIELGTHLSTLFSHMGGKAAFVRAVRIQRVSTLDETWGGLLESPDPSLRCEIARLLRQRLDTKHLPELISWLADRRIRHEARQTIIAMGDVGYQSVVEALSNEALSSKIRRHLPRTLSRFRRDESASVLLGRLEVEEDPIVSYKILRGVGRMISQNPDLRLDRRLVDHLVDNEARRIGGLAVRREFLSQEGIRNSVSGLALLNVMDGLIDNGIENLFRLLGVRFPSEDFRRIYRGIVSEFEKARSSSWELLEHLVNDTLRELLLALTSTPRREPLMMPSIYRPPTVSLEVTLSELLHDPNETIQLLVAQIIAERGIEGLGPAIEALITTVQGEQRLELQQALTLLIQSKKEDMARAV